MLAEATELNHPAAANGSQVLERQHRSNFVTEIVVQHSSQFVGKTLHDLLVGFEGVKILELVREEDVTLRPAPETPVDADDMLLIEGSPQTIHRMLEKRPALEWKQSFVLSHAPAPAPNQHKSAHR